MAQQIITDLVARKATVSSPLSFTSNDQDLFTGKVEKALSRIAAGDVEKIVLSRTQRATVSPRFDLRPALRHLAESYPDCWTFCVDGFFGSSPETLINVTGGHFTAKVLAGTAPRGTDSASDTQMASDLASSSKDLDEHGFASRSVYRALDPLVSQLSMSDDPYTLKLPNVWHLASDIAGELSPEVSSLDIVKALHPTAAVAGTPTTQAVMLISEIEGFDRGRYAGPVGWMGANGDGQWAIGLRCAQLFGDRIEAYAGGGIVSDSIPEKEYVETKMKFRPVLEALS
jgi:menaquinone-specific isochorismate synthase